MSQKRLFEGRSLFTLALLSCIVPLFAQNADSTGKVADSVYLPTAKELSRFRMKHAEAVMHKPTWHIGILTGFNFDYFNFTTQQSTYSHTVRDNVITDSFTTSVPVYKTSPGLGLKFGLTFHPYISDYVAVGVHADGDVGSTPLLFAGGGSSERGATSGYSKNTKYFYGNFNYGLEVTAGFAWLKFLASYDHSLRHAKLSYFEDRYGNTIDSGNIQIITQQSTKHEISMELRHEELTVGVRLFPYSKDKLHIRFPCMLDLAYTLNRDYDFGWKNNVWNYRVINNFYHGVKVRLWVESIIGMSVQVSFPNGYYKAKDSAANAKSDKLLPFIGVSLFYNKDFFAKGY